MMAHPRGARVRANPITNSRAVVREAEWKVMSERIATELRPLVKLAKEQGWTVAGNDNGKLVWRGPNGEGPVYTAYRCQGREFLNYRTHLVNAGLRLDEKTAREHVHETQVAEILDQNENVTIEDLHKAMNTLTAGLSVMIVKAEEYDRLAADAREWEKIATEATETLARWKKEYAEQDTLLDALRATFQMQPWAILPEIARLLGIDAGGPLNQSLAAQATTGRKIK